MEEVVNGALFSITDCDLLERVLFGKDSARSDPFSVLQCCMLFASFFFVSFPPKLAHTTEDACCIAPSRIISTPRGKAGYRDELVYIVLYSKTRLPFFVRLPLSVFVHTLASLYLLDCCLLMRAYKCQPVFFHFPLNSTHRMFAV